jgi:ribonuclease HI
MGRRLSFSPRKYTTVFQAERFAILYCVHYIKTHEIPEKHISICSDSLADLKVLEDVRTTSPLVRQCQEALNNISVRHAVGLFWVPGHVGLKGKETADELARNGSASGFVGPEPALGGLSAGS